jgi:hypothetical protein
VAAQRHRGGRRLAQSLRNGWQTRSYQRACSSGIARISLAPLASVETRSAAQSYRGHGGIEAASKAKNK